MPAKRDPQTRRSERQELRTVSRLLRWSGSILALIGAAGLIIAHPGAWWLAPSWFSLIAGLALALAGIVRREREPGKPPPGSTG